MGQSFEEQKDLDARYLMQTFKRKPVEFVRGADTRLYDDDGKEYTDFLAGIGVCSVGHNNPKVVAAIKDQADKLVHVSNYYYIEHRGQAAERICTMLKGDSDTDWRIFFANSGAEANEGMIKNARRWGKVHKNGACGIITLDHSFHGRTLATLSATAQDAKQDPFAPLPAGFGSVPINDLDALEAVIDEPIDGLAPVAVMVECIQGEAGVWPCTREYLKGVRELTREHNMLLLVDEVQTGFCRTGDYFAFQTFGVEPDIVSMAKGIGDGFPMGAFAARDDIAQLMQPGMHGSTFGGSNLACAAADATTQVMCEPGFLEHVRETGSYFREKLATLPFVTDVRGEGLMVGVSLEKPVAAGVVDAALAHGFVLNSPAADILRFLPPLTIQKEDVDALIAALPTCYEEAC